MNTEPTPAARGAELLTCPFCGGPAEIWRAHPENPPRNAWIACMGRCAVMTKEHPTDAEAIAVWNRRATTPPAEPSPDESVGERFAAGCTHNPYFWEVRDRHHRLLNCTVRGRTSDEAQEWAERIAAALDALAVQQAADEIAALRRELELIAVFADVRAADDSKVFARVNREALRNIASRAREALASSQNPAREGKP